MKKHIPNAITCCNLISGCVAIVFALHGQYLEALWAIIAGAVFDFFDGMTARLLHVSSPIGKELDSLADDITFGVAPSAIVFAYLSELCAETGFTINIPLISHLPLLPYLTFIMAAFSALRLAKFNLDERQALGFIGLPTPANALFWGSLIVGLADRTTAGDATPYIERVSYAPVIPIILVGIAISCWLLVSEIPMFALKFKTWGWQGNQVKYIFIITCIPLLIFLGIIGIAAVIAWYVILSVLTQRRPTPNS